MAADLGQMLEQARRHIVAGNLEEGERLLERSLECCCRADTLASIHNDLASIAALRGNNDLAQQLLELALRLDSRCTLASANLSLLRGEPVQPLEGRRTKIAIVTLFFNWPSTGGGTVHAVELGSFLRQAGYEVRHFYADYPAWRIGCVTLTPPVRSVPLRFEDQEWNAASIQARYREAVDSFAPDWVLVTGCWSFKPLLALAFTGYSYVIRLGAQECLCPLNNIRLLADGDGQPRQCTKHQFATPDLCRTCVERNGRSSGFLHREERRLSNFGGAEYVATLHEAFANAASVLVVNPYIHAMLEPFCHDVRMIPSGFDPDRFPPPSRKDSSTKATKILFAGLPDEPMKGFRVLQSAALILAEQREDFEILVTGEPAEAPEAPTDRFIRFIGWQTQEELPAIMRSSDFLVFPTIAQEGLGRSAVEAMGAGIPVIASRLGGLLHVVSDGFTGMLCKPGCPQDLATKIAFLLDHPELRVEMGRAGRQEFERRFLWPTIIQQEYVPLFGTPVPSRDASLPQ